MIRIVRPFVGIKFVAAMVVAVPVVLAQLERLVIMEPVKLAAYRNVLAENVAVTVARVFANQIIVGRAKNVSTEYV